MTSFPKPLFRYAYLVLVLITGSIATAQDRPNVLFLGVDDLRCSIRSFGDSVAYTPNIDRLAGMGTAFSRAYVQQAVCSASRASLLTGCRPDTTTVDYPYNDYFVNEFLPAHPSLPRFFANQGYLARSGGKIHHSDKHGELRDLKYQKQWKRKGHWRDYALAENRELPRKSQPAYERLDVPDSAYQDGRVADSVVYEIEQYAKGDRMQPFFFAAGFVKPHLPFTAPSKYWDYYDAEQFELPTNRKLGENVTRFANVSYELPSYGGGQIDFDDETRLRKLTHAYYACISFIDANVGRILDALEVNGLSENTIIVFWSDHGFHLGENESFGKHTCFEVATRSPLIVVDPRLQKTQVCDRLVEYVDIFPTLCELTGVVPPDYLEGDSLVPYLRDSEKPGKQAAYSQWPRSKTIEGYSVRTDRYRYTQWRDKSKPKGSKGYTVVAHELYDHQADPGESINLADSERKLAAALSALLK